MRRFLYVITNIIYNVFVQTFLPLIVFVITKDIKYFIISLGIIYTATIIICFSRREKSDSWEKFDLEKMELNTYRKYLVNIIRNELNKNGLKNVKIYSVTGYVMGMSNYGFFIDFNLFNNFLINDKFDLNRFISVIYHEIGHYKSGIVLIKNKFIIFLLQSTLLFQLSMIIKVKFLKLFSNQEMNFKYKFINFLNRVFDVLNLCYTLWLRNDEYYADRYAYINNKYGNLIYYEICQFNKTTDNQH